MSYVAELEEKLKEELREAGFSVGGEMGAHHIYLKVFLSELDTLNTRLEALEEKEPV
ncbi:hypothetical protein RG959_23475 [Domibacillus sp. 8LH]|uniref:hypothetical protein n=1 Tax=Domibacillus sp. 8LH TaxID=3073900 RepID=UPI00317B86FE